MYDLFQQADKPRDGRLVSPELPYLQRTYQRDIANVQTYYRRNPKKVASDNPLAAILNHIPLRLDMDDARYVRFVEDMTEQLSRAFGFTSSVSKGRMRTSGLTLGPMSTEAVVTSYAYFDITKAGSRWQSYVPYKYLYHSRTDLGLPLMNNTTPGRATGVGLLHIPMLALQYRYWRLWQRDRFKEQSEPINAFIGGFVLPNALGSYLDIAVFNRIDRMSQGINTPKFPTAHPFFLTDYTPRIDRLAKETLTQLIKQGQSIEQVLYSVPAITQNSLLSVVQLPREPVTYQNTWALMMARLPYVAFVVRQCKATSFGSPLEIERITESLREAANNSLFSGVAPADTLSTFNGQLKALRELLK